MSWRCYGGCDVMADTFSGGFGLLRSAKVVFVRQEEKERWKRQEERFKEAGRDGERERDSDSDSDSEKHTRHSLCNSTELPLNTPKLHLLKLFTLNTLNTLFHPHSFYNCERLNHKYGTKLPVIDSNSNRRTSTGARAGVTANVRARTGWASHVTSEGHNPPTLLPRGH